MIFTGKYTPPKRPKHIPINQVMGSPFFNIMMKEAEIIPMLEKAIMVNIKIVNAGRTFILLKSNPKNRTPNKRYIKTLIEVKIKFQILEPITIVDIFVGVAKTASKVPIICSSLMLSEKLRRLTIRYSEKAIPMSTKGKYTPPYS